MDVDRARGQRHDFHVNGARSVIRAPYGEFRTITVRRAMQIPDDDVTRIVLVKHDGCVTSRARDTTANLDDGVRYRKIFCLVVFGQVLDDDVTVDVQVSIDSMGLHLVLLPSDQVTAQYEDVRARIREFDVRPKGKALRGCNLFAYHVSGDVDDVFGRVVDL